jgi:hypothetical protein
MYNSRHETEDGKEDIDPKMLSNTHSEKDTQGWKNNSENNAEKGHACSFG